MLGDEEDSSQYGCSPLCHKLLNVVLPLLEQEISERVEKSNLLLREELEQSRQAYKDLSEKYALLQEEMSRSRQAFEKKCQEWKRLKDTLSQRDRLRSLLNSFDNNLLDADTESPASPIFTQNDIVLVEVDSSSQSDENATQAATDLGQSDPLEFLADLVNNSGEANKSQLSEVNSSPVTRAQCITPPPHKRPALTPDPPSTRCEVKQAHANDCSCCSRFYQVAGVMNSGNRKQETSRHRYRDKAPGTPPGFWDINFTQQ